MPHFEIVRSVPHRGLKWTNWLCGPRTKAGTTMRGVCSLGPSGHQPRQVPECSAHAPCDRASSAKSAPQSGAYSLHPSGHQPKPAAQGIVYHLCGALLTSACTPKCIGRKPENFTWLNETHSNLDKICPQHLKLTCAHPLAPTPNPLCIGTVIGM